MKIWQLAEGSPNNRVRNRELAFNAMNIEHEYFLSILLLFVLQYLKYLAKNSI